MRFPLPVKEKIARVLGEYFTTNQIVSVFTEVNIPTDKALYAKWRIALDAFNKLSEPDEGIPAVLEAFAHPLNFEQNPPELRAFIKKLNAVLEYATIEMKPYGRDYKAVDTLSLELVLQGEVRRPSSIPFPIAFDKTSTDYIADALKFFKEEYNKVRLSGLTYEYSLGENANSDTIENGSDEYDENLNAIKRLRDAGFITEFEVITKIEAGGLYEWDYAACKIDESKLTEQKQAPKATNENVEALTQKITHEHTHRFENGDPFKMAITEMPELQVRNIEDTPIPKGKKRVHLPKFSPTDWGKIEWRFIDERHVVITAGKKQVPSDYEALGFKDDKRDKPNTAWALLLRLAQNNGETQQLPTPIPDTIKQHKRQLAERLKAIFKNDTDPFYEAADTRTYRIKIALLPPQTEEPADPFDEAMTEDVLR